MKRDHLQIEHQLYVIGVQEWNAGGLLDRRNARSFSDAVMRCSTSRTEVRYSSILRRSAGPRSSSSLPRLSRVRSSMLLDTAPGGHGFRVKAGVDRAEQSLEDGPRIDIHGQRRIRVFPRESIRVGATRTGVAVAEHARILAAELQRRNPRLLCPSLGGDLIEGRTGVHVGPGGIFRRSARKKTAGRFRMPAALGFIRGVILQAGDYVMSPRKGSSGFRIRVNLKSAPVSAGDH